MGFGCIRVMNCPEWECVGVLPVRVGRLARSFVGDPRHNSGSDRRPEPRLAAQPGMRRTSSCPPMRPGAKPRPPVWRYPSEMALPTWARPATALVPPHSVTGRCPSIRHRHWHSPAASRSLGFGLFLVGGKFVIWGVVGLGAGDGPAPAASSDRHNANRSPRSRWAKSPYCRIRTNPLGMMCSANRRTNSTASSVISLRRQPSA